MCVLGPDLLVMVQLLVRAQLNQQPTDRDHKSKPANQGAVHVHHHCTLSPVTFHQGSKLLHVAATFLLCVHYVSQRQCLRIHSGSAEPSHHGG